MNPPTLQLDRMALAAQVKARALDLGFDLVGIAPADPSRYSAYLRDWLDQGRAGEMSYLSKRFEERVRPGAYLPEARSVICVAMNYYVELEPPSQADRATHGRIARYALGDDYHELIKSRLHQLADTIRALGPEVSTRACVDTAPVLEKDLATRAGIGWLGKNSCLINPHIGSWLLLGEILTTLDLPADSPATDHCGTCTRCIDACPTGAITAPYQLDASRCISYLTIEHRSPIDPELEPKIGDWLYGCDVCQDVCPHNSKAAPTAHSQFRPRFPTGGVNVHEVLEWDDEQYRARLRGSAMKRIKLPVLKRNAAIVAKNLPSFPT
jgi:epoxyqueuosine reductase